jgi:hypothetical protein
MSETSSDNSKKFAAVVLEPRKRLIRLHHTPNKGREYHTVSYYDEFGRRQRRVYPDRSIAEAEATKLRRKIDNGETPGLLLNGRERLIYERALDTARKAGVDLDLLAKDAADARAILGAVPLTDAARLYVEHRVKVVQKTVAEVADELVNDRAKNGKSATYVRDLRTRLGNFASAFKCPISSVELKDIEKYLDTTEAKGRYLKNLIDSIGTLFNFARCRNYVHQSHPGVAPITKPAAIPREIRVLTPAEGRKILLGLPAKFVPAAAVGFFTAMRTAEMDRLDWGQIQLESHIEVTARNAKKKIRRIIPIPPNLKCWLRPFVKAGGKLSPFSTLSSHWKKYAERAGVRWARNIHRDSAISYRVALTKNVQEVALASGNSPQIIMSNYLKCVTEADAKKWFAIKPPKGWNPKP